MAHNGQPLSANLLRAGGSSSASVLAFQRTRDPRMVVSTDGDGAPPSPSDGSFRSVDECGMSSGHAGHIVHAASPCGHGFGGEGAARVSHAYASPHGSHVSHRTRQIHSADGARGNGDEAGLSSGPACLPSHVGATGVAARSAALNPRGGVASGDAVCCAMPHALAHDHAMQRCVEEGAYDVGRYGGAMASHCACGQSTYDAPCAHERTRRLSGSQHGRAAAASATHYGCPTKIPSSTCALCLLTITACVVLVIAGGAVMIAQQQHQIDAMREHRSVRRVEALSSDMSPTGGTDANSRQLDSIGAIGASLQRLRTSLGGGGSEAVDWHEVALRHPNWVAPRPGAEATVVGHGSAPTTTATGTAPSVTFEHAAAQQRTVSTPTPAHSPQATTRSHAKRTLHINDMTFEADGEVFWVRRVLDDLVSAWDAVRGALQDSADEQAAFAHTLAARTERVTE